MATATSVEALSPGDHACLTFTDPDERLDIIAAFVRDGLRSSTKVICLTETPPPDALAVKLADRGVPTGEALARRQLSILGTDDSWLAESDPVGTGMVDLLKRKLESANREGYAGLRVAADMCWVSRPSGTADQLPVFEAEVGRLFHDRRLTAICQYDRDLFDAVTLAFAESAHSRMVAATVYYEDPFLRICRQHSPPGIRVGGEIDFTRVDELTRALNEALRLDHHIQVNLAPLRFLDAAAGTAILQSALALSDGRVMTVVGCDPVLRVLDLLGVRGIPALRVVRPDGER